MTKATLVLLVALSPLGHAQSVGDLLAFGENLFGQTTVPPLPPGMSWTALSTCGAYSLALRSDGAVIPFGPVPWQVQTVPPTPPTAVVVDLAAGPFHALALLSDGNVLAWGDNNFGQTNVPPLPPGVWYVQVAATTTHSLLLRSDGSLTVIGGNQWYLNPAPPLPPGVVYTRIAGGGNVFCPPFGATACFELEHAVALRSDGVVVSWGPNAYGESTVPPLPPGRIPVDIAAGFGTSFILFSDGTALGFGDDSWGQLQVPPLPAGRRYVQIAPGTDDHFPGQQTVGLLDDGSCVTWGGSYYQALPTTPVLPPGLGFTRLANGSRFTTGILGSLLPGASALLVGGGSGTPSLPPQLYSTELPSLGNSAFALRIRHAAPNAPAFVFVADSLTSSPATLQFGRFVYLDPASLATYAGGGINPIGPLITDPNGDATLSLPVPSSPLLAGSSLCFQSAILDPSPVVGFTVTNALRCVLY